MMSHQRPDDDKDNDKDDELKDVEVDPDKMEHLDKGAQLKKEKNEQED